jgi:hypothetical protein
VSRIATHRGEHASRILQAVGYDLRAPGPEQRPEQQTLARCPLLTRRYFSDEFTEVKLVLRVVPMPLTAAMIMMLMPTAIRQYSIAVAPDWSRRNFENTCRIQNSYQRFAGFSSEPGRN